MPSPFPGMNPYFEQPDVWRGFHGGVIQQLAFAIAPQVAPRYFVNYEESLYIDEAGAGERLFAIADVAVRPRPERQTGRVAVAARPVAAPVTARLPRFVQRRSRWLTIRDARDRAVVTVVEVLSPSNKEPGQDRERYLAKRRRVVRSSAHLIEIDLLRGGRRPPLTGLPACDYLITVSRRAERPNVGVWPVGLRDELPAVPIPLRPGEPEPLVPLKPVVDQVYDGLRYELHLYTGSPVPPLSPADAEWARAFVPAAPLAGG